MKEYDLIILGSGFSARLALEKFAERERINNILVIEPKSESIHRFGIYHCDGNSFIQNKIRIDNNDLEKVSKLKNYENINVILRTQNESYPKIDITRNKKIDTIKIDLSKVNIKKYHPNRFRTIELFSKNYKKIFMVNIICIALSYGLRKVSIEKNYSKYSCLTLKDNKVIKEMDNWSSICYKIKKPDVRLNMRLSNKKKKYARFAKVDNISFHYYIKRFKLDNFNKEWKTTMFYSLIKGKYYLLALRYIFNNPAILIGIIKRILNKGNIALYVSIEGDLKELNKIACNKITEYFKRKYKLSDIETNNLKYSINNSASNSHYHSDINLNQGDNIYIIGSSSIGNTYSSNPTSLIVKQINDLKAAIKNK